MMTSRPVSKTKLDTIREATRADMDMQMVIHYNHEGWPKHVPYQLKGCSAARAALSAEDGLLLYGDRIAIPASLWEEVLEQIHRGHQGLTKSCDRAKIHLQLLPESQDKDDGDNAQRDNNETTTPTGQEQ
ncbi:hypothetical protein AAFF_G00116710 [Aldrovandia affinis]|uniref:Uncharacterized protein n=1 Tax=Aldrovandia affinis TaxID=143900 RepID=A0AAD7T1X0_9TELE|nr:hypothetical protein AAFF_G00116710 [Aldrovandia affinis]